MDALLKSLTFVCTGAISMARGMPSKRSDRPNPQFRGLQRPVRSRSSATPESSHATSRRLAWRLPYPPAQTPENSLETPVSTCKKHVKSMIYKDIYDPKDIKGIKGLILNKPVDR
jgi:hypothetical protein